MFDFDLINNVSLDLLTAISFRIPHQNTRIQIIYSDTSVFKNNRGNSSFLSSASILADTISIHLCTVRFFFFSHEIVLNRNRCCCSKKNC